MTGWQEFTLGEVAELIQGGRHKLSGNDFVSEGGFPAFGAGGHNGNLPSYEFDVPGLVLSTIGTCGHVYRATGKWSSLANTRIIFPDPHRCDVDFLWYQINDPRRWPLSGTSQKFIKPSDVNKHRVVLPPLEEQRRIAEVLNKADALRDKRHAALCQFDTLTQSIFLDMIGDPATNPKGWLRRTLGDVVAEFRYGSSNKSASQGRPALRIPNVVGGMIDLTELKLVPVEDAEFESLRLRDGDVLFVRTNGNPDYVGRCAVFDSKTAATSGFDGQGFIFASYLIRARLAVTEVTPIFLREYLLGAEGRRQLRSRSKTSAGQFNINTQGLGAIPVPCPPVPLQREFARRVAAVEKLKATHRASMEELDTLFASLQHHAFSGEL